MQPKTLVGIYQERNPGYGIMETDLFIESADGGLAYNPLNKWNNSTTTGTIMHLCVSLTSLISFRFPVGFNPNDDGDLRS